MMNRKEQGFILPLIVLLTIIFAILGIAVLRMAEHEATLTRIDMDKTRAFYLAEAGLAKLSEALQVATATNSPQDLQGTTEEGSYYVTIDTNGTDSYAISTGTYGSVQKSVRVKLIFLAAPFENAVYAMNESGLSWAFQLRGTGNPVRSGNTEKGGKDIINGNIFLNGDAYFYEESSVNPAPAPNLWQLQGDVGATGNINVLGSAYISGSTDSHAEMPPAFDIRDMDYANNNTHNVAQIFQDAGVSSGYLPSGNPLRNIFVKNPGDRVAECGSTSGDDFFLEPSTGFDEGNAWTAKTPINVGANRVYYIDGDLWVHSKNYTFGFNLQGTATIVVTGNVHLCDNLKYADETSMLGIVALGKYDSWGERTSGGNIYFGDPSFGTLYFTAGMMFAANDFLFNTDSTNGQLLEPATGFTVNGSFSAANHVSIERDWYTRTSGWTSTQRPARFKPETNKWVDAETGAALTSTQINTLRHYQMVVNYDSRVRNAETQPPGLPRGGTKIFAGYTDWEEL